MRAFPFNSRITGYDTAGIPQYDRASNAEELAKLLSSFLANGVFGDTQCPVSAGSGLTVTVGLGCCIIQGRFGQVVQPETVTLAPADSTHARIDTVVLRCDLSGDVRSIVTDVVTGTPAQSPEPPTLTRDGTIWELGIANVRIPSNATGISAASITDTRMDADRCGIVAGIRTEIDTSVICAQVSALVDRLEVELAYVYEGVEKVNIIETSATLTENGWTSGAAPFTQTVTVNGLLGADSPLVDVHLAGVNTPEAFGAMMSAWACIGKVEAGAGTITATCFESVPETDIPIKIKVVR